MIFFSEENVSTTHSRSRKSVPTWTNFKCPGEIGIFLFSNLKKKFEIQNFQRGFVTTSLRLQKADGEKTLVDAAVQATKSPRKKSKYF